jgi:hypothetical protein
MALPLLVLSATGAAPSVLDRAIRWIAVVTEPTGASDRSKRVMGQHSNAPLSGRMQRERWALGWSE